MNDTFTIANFVDILHRQEQSATGTKLLHAIQRRSKVTTVSHE